MTLVLKRNFVEYLQHLLLGMLIKGRVVSSSHFQYSFINYRKIKRRCRRNNRREVYLETSINKTANFRCTRQKPLNTWGSTRENVPLLCFSFPPPPPTAVYLQIFGISGAGREHQKKTKGKKNQQNKKNTKTLGTWTEFLSCNEAYYCNRVIWRNSSRNSKLEVKKRKRSKVEFATEKITSIYFLFFIFIKLSWGAKDKSYNMQLHRISHWHIWNIYIWIEARVLGERGWSWQWRARWDDRS